MNTKRSLGWLAALAALACSGATEPTTPTPQPPPAPTPTVSPLAEWNLRQADGAALPYSVIDTVTQRAVMTLVSEDIVIREDGTYSFHLVLLDHQTEARYAINDWGRWTQTGDRIRLTPEYEEYCADAGELTQDTLRIPSSCEYSVELIYERRADR